MTPEQKLHVIAMLAEVQEDMLTTNDLLLRATRRIANNKPQEGLETVERVIERWSGFCSSQLEDVVRVLKHLLQQGQSPQGE